MKSPCDTIEGRPNCLNVGPIERGFSALIGGFLLSRALKSRNIHIRTAAGIAGAALLHRGYSGFCALYSALGIDRVAEPAPPLPEAFSASVERNDEDENAQQTEQLLYDRRTEHTGNNTPHRRAEDAEQIVAEASEESFPASDSPAWTNVAVGQQDKR